MYFYFQEILNTIWYNFISGLPQLIWAIIVLLIGFLIGKFGGWLVKQFLIKIKLDQYIFEREKFKMKLSDIFSVLTRWIIYLFFILMTVSILNIPELTGLIQSAVTFLAGAVEATVIIIVGYSLAYYIKDKVMQSKTLYGEVVANIIFFLILYVSIAMSLPFIGIDPTLINWILVVIVASFGIGIAIAIGLGLKDVIKDISRVYAKKFMKRRK